MKHDVLVIKDSNGDLFVVTADLLRLAQVKTPDHVELIKELTGNPSLSGRPITKEAVFNIVGSFEIKNDKYLQAGAAIGINYAAPKIVFELASAGAANPS